MADCAYDASKAGDFFIYNYDLFVGQIGRFLGNRLPFFSVLPTGPFAPHVSSTQKKAVQGRALAAGGLINENLFVDKNLVCQSSPEPDQVGTFDYSYNVQVRDGSLGYICLFKGYDSFKGSLASAIASGKGTIRKITNFDVKTYLLRHSGSKAVADADATNIYQNFSGSDGAINTPFPVGAVPNAPLSFKFLTKVGVELRETLSANDHLFGTGGDEHLRFIGGVEMATVLQEEINENNSSYSIQYLAASGDSKAKKQVTGYAFVNTHRGINIGLDDQPLRFDEVDETGFPILIEPEVGRNTGNGVVAVANPAWLAASYEIGFLMANDSFKRLVPEQYYGEDVAKFEKQSLSGELKWHMPSDCNNKFGRWGEILYSIERAYEANYPQFMVPILYQRPCGDLGLTKCGSTCVTLGL